MRIKTFVQKVWSSPLCAPILAILGGAAFTCFGFGWLFIQLGLF